MIADAPLAWTTDVPTTPGPYVMRTPIDAGWHVQFVRLGRGSPYDDLRVSPDRRGRGVRVGAFTDAQWARCPEDLL